MSTEDDPLRRALDIGEQPLALGRTDDALDLLRRILDALEERAKAPLVEAAGARVPAVLAISLDNAKFWLPPVRHKWLG